MKTSLDLLPADKQQDILAITKMAPKYAFPNHGTRSTTDTGCVSTWPPLVMTFSCEQDRQSKKY
jgi:hypothetical protein